MSSRLELQLLQERTAVELSQMGETGVAWIENGKVHAWYGQDRHVTVSENEDNRLVLTPVWEKRR